MRTVPGILDRIADTIERHAMLARGQKLGVAVSGGADSVCLLQAMSELAPRWGLRLTVLHLNHGLRGEESRQDAAFVRELAGLRGLPVHVRELDLTVASGNLEEASREARLDFFREMIANGVVDLVAVGHTRSDQAETVLFRFLRGSGTGGLAGIRPVTSTGIVRPLLDVDRAAVAHFLEARGIPHREDSSNKSLRFARNRIRQKLLPQLAGEWNPAIQENLVQTADWALAEEAYWNAEIEKLAAGRLIESGSAILMRVEALVNLPLAAARRLVRHAILHIRGDLRRIDFMHIAEVLDLANGRKGSGRITLPELEVCRSFEWLRFAPPQCDSFVYCLNPPMPGSVKIPGTDLVITLEIIDKTETSAALECVYNDEVGYLDWGSLSGSLELRSWRPGDRFRPNGKSREEKIKTLFQRARIPIWERRQWPVLQDGSSVVWVRGFGTAADVGVLERSNTILRVRLTGGRAVNSESARSGAASNQVRPVREVS
jgi:tRNA(Ile)-lysidine synthase